MSRSFGAFAQGLSDQINAGIARKSMDRQYELRDRELDLAEKQLEIMKTRPTLGATPFMEGYAEQQVTRGATGGGSNNPMMAYADAIASIESAGSGDYSAVGPKTKKGNRAYGRYQVMDFNVGPWTERHYGRRLSPQEFLNNPEAQDAVFAGQFGSYVQKYGTPEDAASVWFSGRPISRAGNASDGYTTVPEYITKFSNALRKGGTS